MRFMMLFILMIYLTSCAISTDVKAPCDYEGHFCGKKIKINY